MSWSGLAAKTSGLKDEVVGDGMRMSLTLLAEPAVLKI